MPSVSEQISMQGKLLKSNIHTAKIATGIQMNAVKNATVSQIW